MTDQHPITPPRDLLNEWRTQGRCQDYCSTNDYVAACSAQWGYDQRGKVNEAELQEARDEELDACCEWLGTQWLGARTEGFPDELRAARRPKPPSLKEQALKELDKVDMFWATEEFGKETLNSLDTIRRALEALPDE
jgi:hypothetical protein